MAHEVLRGLGFSTLAAVHMLRTFRVADEKRLFQHDIHHNDKEKLQNLAKAANKELEEMCARDARVRLSRDEEYPLRQCADRRQ